jgi:hypothetical protein
VNAERNRRGWLTAETLKAGHIEQHGTTAGMRLTTLKMGWVTDGDCYYVTLEIRKGSRLGRLLEWRFLTFDDIDDARAKFKALKKSHP